MAERDPEYRRSRRKTEQGTGVSEAPPPRAEAGAARRRSRRPSLAPQASSPTGSRQRQRAAERSRRRRLRRRRIALTIAILVVAIGVALGLSRVLSGDEPTGEAAAGATETTVPAAKEDAYLVRITEDGETAAAVLVSAADPGVVIGFPGATLVRGPAGFAPLAQLWLEDDPSAVIAGVADLTGIEPAAVAAVEWTAVLKSLAAAGVSGDYPADLAPAATATGLHAAEGVAALAGAPDGGAVLTGLVTQGDAEGVAAAVRMVVEGQGTVVGLPGREVEGLDYRYVEPDADAVARLLGESVAEEAVSVEVQNGSGAVGIAQQVSELIAPLGYAMLPPKNADDFPNVETTQINAGSAVVGEADRIREILGQGKVVQQDNLPPEQIIIVVGKDLTADSLPTPGEG